MKKYRWDKAHFDQLRCPSCKAYGMLQSVPWVAVSAGLRREHWTHGFQCMVCDTEYPFEVVDRMAKATLTRLRRNVRLRDQWRAARVTRRATRQLLAAQAPPNRHRQEARCG